MTGNVNHDGLIYADSLEPFPRSSARQIGRSGQHQAKATALLLTGLDHFERINTSFGHQIGDFLLSEVESRLRKILPGNTLNRCSGAEFVVILPVGSLTNATFIAHKILQTLHQPFEVGEFTLGLVARIGLAVSQEDEISTDTLLHRARVALSAARNTRQDYFLYSSECDEVEAKKALLTSELRHAISDDQLFMLYQPKIELKTGHVAGVEALVRWQHPQLGVIAPDQFIPLAEETGLITQLTNTVLHKVVRQCQAWNRAGIKTKIAMNLSMWDLQDKNLAAQVPSLLASYDVSPAQLELEITETAIMSSSPRVIDTLQYMRKMGLSLSIDDFGTGQSSLAYLKNLPVNEIKIDQTFVRTMSEDPNDTIIVGSVIDLAHKLGLKTVAEGVENRKTKDMLRHLKCDAAQGYYLSKPISPVQFNDWLRNHEEVPSHQIGVIKEDKGTWVDRLFQLNPFYQYAAYSGD